MKKDPFINIEEAALLIKKGELVIFPTETVYGVGANALDPIAVSKIFELKERPHFDPLIVHISSLDTLKKLTKTEDARIKLLAEAFWPGPLTIVLPKSDLVPDIVTSGLGTVGIRMPDNKIALDLIEKSGCPIAAPSANKFGRLSPTKTSHITKQFPDFYSIIEGGETKVGIESTIITLNDDGFEILRHGIIHKDELEKIIPASKQKVIREKEIIISGMLKSHYSPNTPIYLKGETLPVDFKKDEAGLISFRGDDTEGYKYVKVLSQKSDLKEAAVNLFSALHILEESDCKYILAETVEEKGIGLAIMEKLKKASYQYKIK